MKLHFLRRRLLRTVFGRFEETARMSVVMRSTYKTAGDEPINMHFAYKGAGIKPMYMRSVN
jgi:hypothetical protein